MTNYNIDLRVPLIIRYPNQENKGVQTFEITELVDVFPLLCELAGIETPEYIQGISFVLLIEAPIRPWKLLHLVNFTADQDIQQMERARWAIL